MGILKLKSYLNYMARQARFLNVRMSSVKEETMKKQVVWGALTVCLIGTLLGTIVWAAPEPVLRIGITDSYSGVGAVYASDKLKAARLLKDKVNAAGGVMGRRIEFVVRDDKLSPDQGVRNLIDLYEKQKCDFVIGCMSGGVLLSVSEWCKNHKKMFIAWDARTDRVTEKFGHRYLFRIVSTNGMDARANARFLASQPYTNFFTIGPDYEMGHMFMKAFVDEIRRLKPETKIVGQQWPKLGEMDYVSYVTPIIAAKPEVLVSCLWGADAMTFVKQAKQYGLFDKMKVDLCYVGQSVLGSIGYAMPEGIWASTNWSFTVDTPDNKAFADAYVDAYGEVPTEYSYCGYAGLQVLIAGIEKARSLDHEKVIDSLEGMKIQTPGVLLTLRAYDHQADAGHFITKLRKDKAYPAYLVADVVKFVPGIETLKSVEEIKRLRSE